MALFTDAAVITLDDLLLYEASLGEVAAAHAIDVDSKISLAISTVGEKLLLWLLNIGVSDPQWLTRRVLGLSTVVLTDPLLRWIVFESISRTFSEAYNVQLNTRFQGKWREYQAEAQKAADLFLLAGTGIVYNPLPKPGTPLVSIQSGNAPAQTIFVQTSWVDANANESALSIPNSSVLPDNSGIVVAMAEGALQAPTTAVGWNVYANGEASGLTRQNTYPLAIGSTWQLPGSGLQIGPQPVDGQLPVFYVMLSKQIRRG